MNTKKIIWLSFISALLVGGCQLFPPSNIETVVAGDYISYWHLSPNGDYLVYGNSTSEGNFLLDLATGQKHQFDCDLLWWDNNLLGCYKPLKVSVINIKTLIETPLIQINLTEKMEIEEPTIEVNLLLEKADIIYRPEWVTDTIYIIAPDYEFNTNENYVIKGLTNLDELLTKYIYKSIPKNYPKIINNPVSSPNGLYYYDFTIEGFSIFTTDNNKVVAGFTVEEAAHLQMGGWASNNSGVYFTTYRGGFIGSGMPEAIYKLKIPSE